LSGLGESFEADNLGSGVRLINWYSKGVSNNCRGLWVYGAIRKSAEEGLVSALSVPRRWVGYRSQGTRERSEVAGCLQAAEGVFEVLTIACPRFGGCEQLTGAGLAPCFDERIKGGSNMDVFRKQRHGQQALSLRFDREPKRS
jgi:hypothetical protein